MAAAVSVQPATPSVETLLKEAFERRIEAEVRPTVTLIDKLNTQLAAYSFKVKADAKQKALIAMLAAVGEEAQPQLGDGSVEIELRSSLLALLDLVGGVPPFVTAAPAQDEAETADEGAIPQATTVPQIPDADVEEAKAVLAEITRLRQSNFRLQPMVRLTHEIQWLVASTRLVMSRFPESHHLHWQLSEAMSKLGKTRHEAGITTFVSGLQRDQTFDWEKLVRESARALARFDAEPVERTTDRPTIPESRPKIKATPATQADPSIVWPPLPLLRAQVQDRTFALIGGLAVNEKVELIRKKFGFEMEWLEIDQGAARETEAIVRRIRGGTIGAAIVLESFMPHKASNLVVDALNACQIPWAYGGRCGVGTIDNGLTGMEVQLQQRES